MEQAERVAGKLRAGRVYLNGASVDVAIPFGGYRQSVRSGMGLRRRRGVAGGEVEVRRGAG
ncbi:hypothetical protein LGM59_29370 [Burkholderia metallica]|nr:hypothetical protein [Burkholderia metallica]